MTAMATGGVTATAPATAMTTGQAVTALSIKLVAAAVKQAPTRACPCKLPTDSTHHSLPVTDSSAMTAMAMAV